MEDFLRINEIETLRELPAETSTLPWNEVYKMRVGSLLKRDFKKRRFFYNPCPSDPSSDIWLPYMEC